MEVSIRVLITGAAGMLGKNLHQKLTATSNFQVRGLTRGDFDLRDRDQFEDYVRKFKPDVVVHGAAKVGGIGANLSHPAHFLAENLELDTSVILGSQSQGVSRLLYLGSSCMYPANIRQPLIESDVLTAALEPSNEGYALAKITGAKLCEFLSRAEGVAFRTIIPSNLYGPGDNFDPDSSHLLASIIRKIHSAKLEGRGEIDVWGSGEVRREFTFIGDLVDWMSKHLARIEDFPQYLNVGSGEDYSVTEYYQIAMSALQFNADLRYDMSKPEGMKRKLMSSEVAAQLFGWRPKTKPADGIRQTYRWFSENRGNV